jgi:hypothetical protein
MGVMKFSLPPGLPLEHAEELERACVSGGPDSMPYPTHVLLDPETLTLVRDLDESGVASVPCHVPGRGLLMTSTATLMEREQPYNLLVELARGKVNQVRCQSADWQARGILIPPAIAQQVREASLTFGRAVTRAGSPEAAAEAADALALAYSAADKLVQSYVNQLFSVRHQRQPRLDTTLACMLGTIPPEGEQTDALQDTFGTLCVPFPWPAIEPGEGECRWEAHDALVDWASARGFHLVGGPPVDFSLTGLPGWVWLYERDRSSVAGFICEHVHGVVTRYHDRIRSWQVSAAVNLSSTLTWNEEELLWLTLQMVETVRRIDPSLEISVCMAQPWGEYLVAQDHSHSPFVFADSLLRSGANLTALDLELVMGVTPRGSYCRDLLETERLLELYALLGLPLRLTLGYPCQAGQDKLADSELRAAAGYWGNELGEQSQAEWAEAVTALALAKPFVRAVQWTHFSDALPHRFPYCGLVDASGKLRPALQGLQKLRHKHLH